MSQENENIESVQMATEEQLHTIEEFVEQYKEYYNSIEYTDLMIADAKRLELDANRALSSSGYSPQLGEQVFDQYLPIISKSSTEIQELLKNPRKNDDVIRQASRAVDAMVPAYKRIVSFLSDVKSFKYFLKCDSYPGEIDSTKYEKDKKKIYKRLKGLNIPYQFREIDKKTTAEGISFWLYYKDKERIRFLPVPTEYCYVTGPSTLYGLTWAIDLTFVDSMLNLYDCMPELNHAYAKFNEMRMSYKLKKPIRGKDITKEDIFNCQYFIVPPSEGCVLAFNEISATRTPPMAGAMSPALDTIAYRSLLKKKSTADLYTMVIHQIPRDDKTGKFLLTFDEASSVISAIQKVSPDNIKHAASMFDKPEAIKITTSDVLQTLNKIGGEQLYETAGISADLFNTDNRTNNKATEYALGGIAAFASAQMYTYLTNTINYLINMKGDLTYEWSIFMYGNTILDQEEKTEARSLANLIGNPYILMSAYNIEPFNVENLLGDDLAKIKQKIEPFKTAATQSGKENDNGRPTVEETTEKEVTPTASQTGEEEQQ